MCFARLAERDGLRSGCGALLLLQQPWRHSDAGCRKALQSVEIPTIVPLFFHGSFEYEGLAAQLGMPENPAETVQTDVTFADIRMPIYAGAERRLRIVRVNYVNV